MYLHCDVTSAVSDIKSTGSDVTLPPGGVTSPATPPTQPLVNVVSTGVWTGTTAPRLNISSERLYIGHHRRNGRLKIMLRRYWIGTCEISPVWHDATLDRVDTTSLLHDGNPRLVDATTVFLDAITALLMQPRPREPISGFPPEMLNKHQFEHQFLLQLLGGSKIEEYNIPIIVKADLGQYQRDRIRWLAFLAKYQLLGILCDDGLLQDGTQDAATSNHSFSQVCTRASKSSTPVIPKSTSKPRGKTHVRPVPHLPGKNVPNLIALQYLEALSLLAASSPVKFLVIQPYQMLITGISCILLHLGSREVATTLWTKIQIDLHIPQKSSHQALKAFYYLQPHLNLSGLQLALLAPISPAPYVSHQLRPTVPQPLEIC
ncbi:hypothetical protein PCANC_18595 [Puccinia coronata f. sp. avenae]|uniref:Uncharacterized protein n=1 Tax=Puccinia coronata f. sp. avenae TaxID=200324 RepID=A0A2N5TMI2_9BASI|nr:hypothetical protein PCANC_25751 [Puccinia coronata f. sp. avenae]PLW26701.1 hypothetical protein PCANC_18595 [Puccinia coronata f. sp. avenae]